MAVWDGWFMNVFRKDLTRRVNWLGRFWHQCDVEEEEEGEEEFKKK